MLGFSSLAIVLFSCQSKEEHPRIKKILVIGNSITIHPPDPSIGWNAAWGMAATGPNRDFFSLLKDSLQYHFPQLEMIRENVYPFERQFETLDFEQYDYLKEFEADIIIIRLGENIPENKLLEWNLSEALQDFATYLGTADTKFIITTTFWPRSLVNEQLLHAASINLWEVVDIGALGEDPAYMAIGQFENHGVAAHPNDLGMYAISKALSTALLALEL